MNTTRLCCDIRNVEPVLGRFGMDLGVIFWKKKDKLVEHNTTWMVFRTREYIGWINDRNTALHAGHEQTHGRGHGKVDLGRIGAPIAMIF